MLALTTLGTLVAILSAGLCQASHLYPKASSIRQTKSLDGIWQFLSQSSLDPEEGFRNKWFESPMSRSSEGERVIDMPVPSSFNDITTLESLRDFVGWVWYDREFYIPSHWNDQRVFLRFGSAHYTSMVWINGYNVMNHSGGHLPFEADVTQNLQNGRPNRVTVALNNTLGPETIPQGKWKWFKDDPTYPSGYFEMQYSFDFYNYGGIHRPVTLYTVPKLIHIHDIKVATTFVANNLSRANISYEVTLSSEGSCTVDLLDKHGNQVAHSTDCHGLLSVVNPHLWWPYLMSEEYGYLYTLKVSANNSLATDEYLQNVGLRFVSWDNTTFKINHKPFYFKGFGRHEDSNIRGKGLDLPLVAKDYNLIRWTGANSYRTSHYPYADELMDFADRNGIVIIDECPAVNLEGFKPGLLQNHLRVMEELIARDKNHPSVVMWSLGNEPRSNVPEAKGYFQTVADHVRSLDPTRPTILVMSYPVEDEQGGYAVDILGLNRYYGWYSETGLLELIANGTVNEVRKWNQKFGKPLIMTEYGGDTISGFHEVPSTIFTEEYQVELMKENFRAFDQLRQEGILIGEMIWNFADFMTKQDYVRAWGNRKGIFTRDRHPKMSAHVLRERYWNMTSVELTDP